MTLHDDFAWLPPLIPSGSFDDLCTLAGQQFDTDFPHPDNNPVLLQGKPVRGLGRDSHNGINGDAWHIVSTGPRYGAEQLRVGQVERARHMPLIRAVLAQGNPDVVRWRDPKDTKKAIVAVNTFEFIVVLGARSSHWRIITGYHVRGGGPEKQRKSYEEAVKRGLAF